MQVDFLNKFNLDDRKKDIYTTFSIFNCWDIAEAIKGLIAAEDIKRKEVKMRINFNSVFTMVNERIKEELDLPVIDRRKIMLENGDIIICDMVSPLRLKFKGRSTYCSAIVLPEDSLPLLGTNALYEMNLVVNENRDGLIENHEERIFIEQKIRFN